LQKATERPKREVPPSAFDEFVKKIKKTAQSTILQAARSLDVADVLMAGKLAEVEAMIARFQKVSQSLRYSMVPTVAAVDGLALGGGCEFVMHCDRAVATLETYIGWLRPEWDCCQPGEDVRSLPCVPRVMLLMATLFHI
jgi:3-hydroxyacyl-CoA dehydrogenase